MKKTRNYYLYLLLGFIHLAGVSQNQEGKFSLQEAIDYALQHNRQVQNADLSIQAAEKQKWETIALGLPQINANIEYNNAFSREAFIADNPQFSFFFPRHKTTSNITLSQLLFDGSYLVGLQASKVFLEISENAKIKTDKEITKAVTSAYSNLLLVQESIAIFDKNIQNLEANIKESKALLDNGFIEEENLEQLQITLNDLNNNTENLKSIEQTSLKMLKLLLGLNHTKEFNTLDDLNTLSNPLSIPAKTSENIKIKENIDYIISENSSESKRLLYKLEQSKALPTVVAFVNGNNQSQSNDTFGIYDGAEQSINTGVWGVTVDIPIFSSFQRTAKIKRAKIEWQKAKNDLINTQKEIELSIENAQSELNLANKTLENKQENLKLAEKIEAKNNIKYKEGIASSFELRQAQMQLYSSQQEYLQAMVNVINKQAELNALKK